MPEWFWSGVAILLVAVPIVFIAAAFLEAVRTRFTRHIAAKITIWFGFLIFSSPEVFYKSLPVDGKEAITWVGALIFIVGCLMDAPWLQRRGVNSK